MPDEPNFGGDILYEDARTARAAQLHAVPADPVDAAREEMLARKAATVTALPGVPTVKPAPAPPRPPRRRVDVPELASTVLELCGVTLICVAVFLANPLAGLIVTGAFLILVGFAMSPRIANRGPRPAKPAPTTKGETR